jgi:hypothetical protein
MRWESLSGAVNDNEGEVDGDEAGGGFINDERDGCELGKFGSGTDRSIGPWMIDDVVSGEVDLTAGITIRSESSRRQVAGRPYAAFTSVSRALI